MTGMTLTTRGLRNLDMTGVYFTFTTDDPSELLAELRAEIERRRAGHRGPQGGGARTRRERDRHKGAIEALDGVLWMLDRSRVQPAGYCPAAHEHLIAMGYRHTHHEAGCTDDGDGESGPMPRGWPASDEYFGPRETVYINSDGIAHLEAWGWFHESEFERLCECIVKSRSAGEDESAEAKAKA